MDNIMELLYHEPLGNWRAGIHPQDSEFVRTAQIKSANLNMLMDKLE